MSPNNHPDTRHYLPITEIRKRLLTMLDAPEGIKVESETRIRVQILGLWLKEPRKGHCSTSLHLLPSPLLGAFSHTPHCRAPLWQWKGFSVCSIFKIKLHPFSWAGHDLGLM